MRFLNLLFWLVVVALATALGIENWRDVTINLWGDLQADIKIPVLLALTLLLGWLSAYLVYRARLWRLRRSDAARAAGPSELNQEELE
jgi:uncharacterized membrane protein YciS (DUF1049 family)